MLVENIPEKWTPEVKHFCPSVPIILVGNKKDLRNDEHTWRELAKMKQVGTALGAPAGNPPLPMPGPGWGGCTPQERLLLCSGNVSKRCFSCFLGAGEARGGKGHGQQNQCLWLPGVLGQDEGGGAGGVRDGHAGRPAGAQEQEAQRLPAAVSGRAGHRPHPPGRERCPQPGQDLPVPPPAPSPLHQSCHPRPRRVPVTSGAVRGPCLQNLLLSVGRLFLLLSMPPGLCFPWALPWCLLSVPSSGQVPQKQEAPVTAHLWALPALGVLCPLSLAVQAHTAALQMCPGSLSPACEQSWAQLLPGALIPGRAPSSAGVAAFESASVMDLAALNPTA